MGCGGGIETILADNDPAAMAVSTLSLLRATHPLAKR
jgi:hypothetical protein